MKNIIADLHVHPGLKGYANEPYPENEGRTIWNYYPAKEKALNELNVFIRDSIKELAMDSQANFDACAETGLFVPFISIYPVERQMFALERKAPFRFILNLLLPDKKIPALGAAVSGFPRALVQKILDHNVAKGIDDGVNYYEQYQLERGYLIRQTAVPSDDPPGYHFTLVRNYEELMNALDSGDRITGILTVEGAHSFGHYLHHSTFKKSFDELNAEEADLLRDSFLNNVLEVKNHAYVPFFVTFCHHFNNLLAGHARSMSAEAPLIKGLGWPNLPGMRHIFNQEPGLNNGFTPLGEEVMKLLLDREKGRRILIDVKHMSINTRRQYYQYVAERRAAGDQIPIICSHAAVNGWPTLDEAQQHSETKNLDKDSFFSRWQINLTDEDILVIYDSDGMIGLVLHEGRMPGGILKTEAKKLKKEIHKCQKKDTQEAHDQEHECCCRLKDVYLKTIWSNIFQTVKVVRDARQADGWKILALGSDYDGLINPFNQYYDVKTFGDLKTDLVDYIRGGKAICYADKGVIRNFTGVELKELLAGRSPEEAVEEVFFTNVQHFLEKYFQPEYLEGNPGLPRGSRKTENPRLAGRQARNLKPKKVTEKVVG